MLTEIHFLLTYTCTYECDHCFLYCSPEAKGTFSLDKIRRVFAEMKKIGSIEWVYFEGGEPFLYYPLLLEGLRITRDSGMKAGVVSNAYWATSLEDAELWLVPLRGLDVSDLSLSDDVFHHDADEESPAKVALRAAGKIGVPVNTICIEEPTKGAGTGEAQKKGEPVVGGEVKFRGRAVEKLTEGLPRKPWTEFDECPHEDFEDPRRIHIDSYGNVQFCQGLSIGNFEEIPLSELILNYKAASHPICGPLAEGGPARLAKAYDVEHDDAFVDACHFCYHVRLALMDRFPQFLTPRQVYGLK